MFRLLWMPLLILSMIPQLHAASRDTAWKEVQQALDQGQPRTALEKLEPIVTGALADRAWAEAAKAIGRRIAVESMIAGRRPEERVIRFQQALEASVPELKPVFHALLAHAYWGYFQQNRWRFHQRTPTAEPPGDDFQTWDLRRILSETDAQFTAALADPARLRSLPITDFDALLERGTLPDALRPTLYDFLAHEALHFYAAGDHAGAQPQNAFVVQADSPVFDAPAAFLAWAPATTDTASPALKAIRLHQELLRFHQNNPQPDAFLDADLTRIEWAGNVATGPSRDARHLAALEALATRAGNRDIGARIRVSWATRLQQLDRLAEAHAVATLTARDFPQTPATALARNLLRQIEMPEARVETERIWNVPWPDLQVTHRNQPRLWFRIVAGNWDDHLRRQRSRPESPNREERDALLRQTPTRAWVADLPPTPDFQPTTTLLPPPQDLPPGFYFLITSRQDHFRGDQNEIQMTPFWVSDLSLVVRSRAGANEGFVLDARTGEPLNGARLEGWYLNRSGDRVALTPTSTDPSGFFSLASPREHRSFLIKASHQGRQVALSEEIWPGSPPQPNEAQEQVTFFTDRALYRPGQAIQYKGILFRIDRGADRPVLRPGARRELTIVFRDPNDTEIARATHRVNDYGSFSGTFTAPRDRGTGEMELVAETVQGSTQFNVEEYKRPRFLVTLDAPTTAPRLNDSVTLTGRALAYTGAPVDTAEVAWRVVRQVRFPPWWGWFARGHLPNGEAQEIAHGTTTTAVDGTFTVTFPALPDPSASEEGEPVFEFEVHAEITDGAGETRVAQRTVRVGHAALALNLTANDWQTVNTDINLTLTTRSLDDQDLPATGTVKVHRLREPDRVPRPPLTSPIRYHPAHRRLPQPPEDPADPQNWEPGELTLERSFRTGTHGRTNLLIQLPVGAYRLVAEAPDRFGRKVTSRLTLVVADPEAPHLALRIPHRLTAPQWTLEPGQEFVALWGTGYDTGRACLEIERNHRILERIWTEPGRTQQTLRRLVDESMRGGFTLHVTQVRENRAYLTQRQVVVPWSDHQLDLRWETFRSHLTPGSQETWTAVVTRPPPVGGTSTNPIPALAEWVATLYDASLDAFGPLYWTDRFPGFRQEYSTAHTRFANQSVSLNRLLGNYDPGFESVSLTRRQFPADLVGGGGRRYGMSPRLMTRTGVTSMEADSFAFTVPAPAAAPMMLADASMEQASMAKGGTPAGTGGGGTPPPPPTPAPDPSTVSPRRNLQETAFFLPHLLSDSNGVVRLTFTLPEALTEWRFLGFAHDRELRAGTLNGTAVTSKDLMVRPNPPRFLREGDVLEFPVQVVNRSDQRQRGKVRLDLRNAFDEQSLNTPLGLRQPEQSFDVPAGQSRTYFWRLEVPDATPFLVWKAVATTGSLSDGEEAPLPVLSRRVFLTESLPLPIRGPARKEFVFQHLADAPSSPTLQHSGLHVQMVSHPAWYAVLALPYLMEFPHECAEQVFNRYYANALAAHLAQRDPRIRQVFDQWRNTPALDSPLEKNPELKAVALAETPWARQARNESQARRQIGTLFETTRLNAELQRALQSLSEMQDPNGAWPWFPGGRPNEFITRYIIAGFGRLRQAGVPVDPSPALRAVNHLDQQLHARWEKIREDRQLDGIHLDPGLALALYARTFFLADIPIDPAHRESFDFWVAQARTHWLKLDHRQPQGHVALALHRLADAATANAIVRSLHERSVTHDELGRYWREDEHSLWWFRAPIETHALMIEVFAEIARDTATVEELQVWLLKQRQTQDWKTTKATADAVHALLARGPDLLGGSRLVEVQLGSRRLTPQPGPAQPGPTGQQTPTVEPGTGFYEIHVPAAEITPDLARVTVTKADPGISWGSVHWQYFEDLAQVRADTNTPLKLTKTLFVRRPSDRGPQLVSAPASLKVGDELVVRIELRTDRDLEFVHLKDARGSGTEPVQVLSGTRFQDGLMYYESVRDTASHFFIEYLPKGTYVFQYPVRIQHRGLYPMGVAEVQCMYAPEFGSHSSSPTLRVD